MEERGVSEIRVEVSVVEQVVLVALVTLDALQPALNGVHGLQHGAQVVMYREVAAQRAAGAHNRLLLYNREYSVSVNASGNHREWLRPLLPSKGAGRACQSTSKPTWS